MSNKYVSNEIYILSVSAHLFCHPKVNVFCHAGTRSVKAEALHFVRTPTYFVKAADASGKTKAINPTCAAAQEKTKTVSSRLRIHREDTVFAYSRKSAIIEVTIL